MNNTLSLTLGAVRAGGEGGAPAILGPAPTVALTSAPTAYPPTISLAFPGGVEEIGDTVTLKRFVNPADLTVWPNLSAPDVSQTFTLTSTVAALQAQINAALASISSGTGLIYLTHTPQGGSESHHSLAVLYGVGAAPTLITTNFSVLGDTQMARTIVFSHPVEAYPALVDGDKVELFPIKPDGNVATEFEAPNFAYSPRWQLRWLNNGTQDFYNPGDFNGNNTFEVGFDLIRSANGLTALAENRALTITVTENDTTGPVWVTASTANVVENQPLNITLSATDLNPVTYSISGGANAADFEVSGTTLRFASNGTRPFGSGPFIVVVRATDSFGNFSDRTITITVIQSVPATHHASHIFAAQTNTGANPTFSGGNIGAANPNRLVIAMVNSWVGSLPLLPTGVTINGIAATLLNPDNANSIHSLWIAAVPTGTTATVVVQRSSFQHVRVMLESIITTTPTPSQVLTTTWANSTTATLNATTPTDGLTLGFAVVDSPTATVVWTGATPLQNIPQGSFGRLNSALRTSAGTSAITITSSASANRSLVAVSFGP